jgi:hypothetical protein
MSDPFATVMSMQSEQMRQRKRERKRLEREEMRRSRQRSLPVGIAVSVGWRRRVVPDDEAQMCAPPGRVRSPFASPHGCAVQGGNAEGAQRGRKAAFARRVPGADRQEFRRYLGPDSPCGSHTRTCETHPAGARSFTIFVDGRCMAVEGGR